MWEHALYLLSLCNNEDEGEMTEDVEEVERERGRGGGGWRKEGRWGEDAMREERWMEEGRWERRRGIEGKKGKVVWRRGSGAKRRKKERETTA